MRPFIDALFSKSKLLFPKGRSRRLVYCCFCQNKSNLAQKLGEAKVKPLSSPIQQNTKKPDDFKENIYTIPNALCLTRIILSPVLGYTVIYEYYSVALGIFVFAGLTDLVDGFIARNVSGQMSNLGSVLDPLADKLLVSILFLSLTYAGLFPVWLTVLIILRDVALVLGGCYVRYSTLDQPKSISRFFDMAQSPIRIKPTTISKINTGIQLTTVAATLASQTFGFADHPILHFAWYLTAVTTVSSGLSYALMKNTYEKL